MRGGAPFLSGADARLLVEWLEAGIPVASILAAVEAAATRRARRPTRTRLSLSACQGELKKRAERRAAPAVPSFEARDEAPRAWPALAQLAGEIRGMETPPALEPARDRLAEGLDRLARGQRVEGGPLDDPSGELVARQAIAACRVFQDAAWKAAAPEREALLARAAEELASLREIISEEAFQAAVEEVARDRVRARTPLVSAVVVWDRVIGTG